MDAPSTCRLAPDYGVAFRAVRSDDDDEYYLIDEFGDILVADAEEKRRIVGGGGASSARYAPSSDAAIKAASGADAHLMAAGLQGLLPARGDALKTRVVRTNHCILPVFIAEFVAIVALGFVAFALR